MINYVSINRKIPLYISQKRNNPVNLQYERFFFNLRKNFTCTLQYFMCLLLSVTVQDVELTVQDVETKGNPVSLTPFSY